MAVIPSFHSFAPTPNLASSYLGGAKLGLEQQQLQQQAAQHAAELAARQAQLQQQAQLAEMEMQAKERQFQQASLRQQQELEIEKAYKQQQIGLHERELEQSAAKLAQSVKMASDQFAANQKVDELIAGGMDPLMARLSVTGSKPPSGAYSAWERQMRPAATAEDFGPATPLLDAEGNPTGKMQAMSGRGSRRIFDVPGATPTATPIPGAEGYIQYGNKVLKAQIPDSVKTARDELKAFDTAHKSTLQYITGSEQPDKRDAKRFADLANVRSNLQFKATLPASLTKTATSVNEVSRKTKDGRTAIYNADTKEFIRYEQ